MNKNILYGLMCILMSIVSFANQLIWKDNTDDTMHKGFKNIQIKWFFGISFLIAGFYILIKTPYK
jgi:hypothetical protein